LNIANIYINTSLINDINKISSNHKFSFNEGFSSNSSQNIRRAKFFNDLSVNFDPLIVADHVWPNEISDDVFLHNFLKNGSVTIGKSFHLNNFNLNEIVISNNSSNIIMNPEPELI